MVLNVGIRCFQKHNNNACTRRDSHRVGIVSVHIPVRRMIRSTLLFNKSENIIKTADPKIHIMLIHQNYRNPVKTLLLDDVYNNKVNEYDVKMKPRIQQDTSESER